MNVFLIEPILDRYVAQVERREKDLEPKRSCSVTVETPEGDFGLPQVMDALRTTLIYRLRTSETASELWN